MKAKRFFAAALMVLMVLGLFGACGKKKTHHPAVHPPVLMPANLSTAT